MTESRLSRRERVRLSKTIAHALRHEPWLYELELDEDGWVSVNQLLEGLQRHRSAWVDLSFDDLTICLEQSEKQRFEIREDRIRAFYGHSIAGLLDKTPAEPPENLYHGTTQAALPFIRETGLHPMSRNYVHFSTDRETAQLVAERKGGSVVLLIVRALEAQRAGVTFYHGNEMVWLADHVPPIFIDFPS
ncbi:MAG: RNA 2'-phosphotransferase [Chloroflexi bacterium]|nr:RNA 2'-phosphotransferase [Chloroflexota bacterium]